MNTLIETVTTAINCHIDQSISRLYALNNTIAAHGLLEDTERLTVTKGSAWIDRANEASLEEVFGGFIKNLANLEASSARTINEKLKDGWSLLEVQFDNDRIGSSERYSSKLTFARKTS